MPKSVLIENKYIVTNDGRVFTYMSNWRRWKEQKPRKHSNGYLRATIFGKDEYIHRLVAKYFVPNPKGLKEVNHIDGNKKNNSADNLEWCTRSRNNKHAFEIGLRSYEELKNMAKMPKLKRRVLTPQKVIYIRESSKTDRELARLFGVSRGTIYQARKSISYKEVA